METELVPAGRTVNLAGYAAQVWEIRPDYSKATIPELERLATQGDTIARAELWDRSVPGMLTTHNLLLSGDLKVRGRARFMIDRHTGLLYVGRDAGLVA